MRFAVARRIGVLTLGAVLAAACAAPPAFSEPGDGRHAELISSGVAPGRDAIFMRPDISTDGNDVFFGTDATQFDSSQGGPVQTYVARRASAGWSTVEATLPTDPDFRGDPSFQTLVVPPGARRILVSAPGRHDPVADVGKSPTAFSFYTMVPGERTARAYPGPLPSPGQQTVSSVFGETGDGLSRTDQGGVNVVSRFPDGTLIDPANMPRVANPIGLYGFNFDFDRSVTDLAGSGRGAISVDGRRLYFVSGVDGSSRTDSDGNTYEPLFLRDGDRTLAVSQSAADGQLKQAKFIGASSDGDVAYFVVGETLTSGIDGAAVYRYQVSATEPLKRLTPGLAGGTLDTLAIRSAWASRDGSTVAFASEAALAPGATAGTRNAYVWRGDSLRFAGDLGTDGTIERISGNGQYTLMRSSANVAAGSNTGGQAQLFRYSFPADRMQCVSCRSDGSANEGPSQITRRYGLISSAESYPRAVADDGHVFFTASDRLLPGDPSAADDVYEFTGTGLRLLSNGTGLSRLADNSDDGQFVYLTSTASLTAEDNDGGFADLFVRRTGDDIARPVAPSPCAGDVCQGQPRPLLADSGPASSRVGPGNLSRAKRPAASLLGAPSLSAAARRALSRGDRGDVRVRVRGSGRLSIRVTAVLGGSRQTVGSGSASGRKASIRTAAIGVKLNAKGRRALRRAGRLLLRVEARFGPSATRTSSVILRTAGGR